MPIPLADLTTGTGTATLTSDERNWVREVLGVSKASNDSKYRKSENRFEAFEAYENQSARYWMAKYEEQGETILDIDAEGASLSKSKTRARFALALYNLIFAEDNITPLEDINIPEYRENTSRVSMVAIRHTDDDVTDSEY